jgi:signal transduction histidine kinase
LSQRSKESGYETPSLGRLLAYVAHLELEVDRLRRHNHLLWRETREALEGVAQVRDDPGADAGPRELAALRGALDHLAGVFHDLRELPGYHPANDQVVAIAVRPLAEQVFRWQQRLQAAPAAELRLELESDHVEWFPARLRHVLDNLFSNALKFRDPAKAEAWVRLGLRVSPQGYEFRVSDNGIGLESEQRRQVFELFYRAVPARAAGLGVGLAVVRLLVEQSGGTLTVDSAAGQGTTFVVTLPRYALEDFLF